MKLGIMTPPPSHAASPLIYVVAGEPSGDLLGARLIASVRKLLPAAQFAGVGGPMMEKEGLRSLFPYKDLTVIGVLEVLPHIPRLLKRLASTLQDIRTRQPVAIITIDSPGFNFRLVERMMEEEGLKHITRIHYVAPTVWAYRPKRAFRAARILNHLLLLLPFEPPYFDAVKLPNTYVGHPVLWEERPRDGGAAFRQRHHIPAHAPLLCILPGSRRWEVSRLMPVFEKTIALLKTRFPELHAVTIAGRQVDDLVRARAQQLGVPLLVVGEEEKKDAFSASTAALTKSGTVTLELAMAGVPMVMTYKVSAYSAWAIRRTLKTKYFNLLNIIEDKMIIPELIQEACRPELLANSLAALLSDTETRRTQLAQIKNALVKLGGEQPESPNDVAAKKVIELIRP